MCQATVYLGGREIAQEISGLKPVEHCPTRLGEGAAESQEPPGLRPVISKPTGLARTTVSRKDVPMTMPRSSAGV